MTDRDIERAIVREVQEATLHGRDGLIGAGALERAVLEPVRGRYRQILARLVTEERVHVIRWPKERSYSARADTDELARRRRRR